MTRPLTVRHWAIGATFLGLVLLYVAGHTGHANPIALFVLLLGVYRLARSWLAEKQAQAARQPAGDPDEPVLPGEALPAWLPEEEAVTPRRRLTAALTCFAQAALLVAVVHYQHELLVRHVAG